MPSKFGKLIGEERNIEQKQTTFFCLNQMTGETLWEGLSVGEGWWIGIEDVHRDVVYLHKFAAPDMPQHKEIIAIDILTGKQLWANADLAFVFAAGETIFATQESLEGRQIFELEYRTGAILRGWGSDEQVVREARIRSITQDEDSLELPKPVVDIADDPSSSAMYIRNHCPVEKVVGVVEGLDKDPVFVFNYHEQTPASTRDNLSVNNILNIVEKKTDSVVYHETLNRNARSIVPESFFVQGEMVFYVKERRILTAVRISQQEST